MINEELIMVTGGREIETNGNPVGSNDVSKCNAYLIGRSKQGVLFDLHENLTLEQTILVDFNTLSKQTVLDCTSTEKWIERNFEGKPLHVHLCNLELIKHKILCAEKEIYKALIKR